MPAFGSTKLSTRGIWRRHHQSCESSGTIVTTNGSQFRILPNPAGGDPIVEYRGPDGWAPYHGPVAGPGGSAVGGDPDTVLPYTPPFNAY